VCQVGVACSKARNNDLLPSVEIIVWSLASRFRSYSVQFACCVYRPFRPCRYLQCRVSMLAVPCQYAGSAAAAVAILSASSLPGVPGCDGIRSVETSLWLLYISVLGI
jgi:hypothetical protein